MKPRRSIPRWAFAVAAAVVIAAAADAAVFAVARGGSARTDESGRDSPRGDGLEVIDPVRGRVVTRLDVGSQPTMVVAGYGSVWVLNKSDGTVSHIDTKSRRIVRTINLEPPADDLTLGEGGLWIAGHGRLSTYTPRSPHGTTAIRRLDPATDKIERTIEIKTGAVILAAGGGALWTTGFVDGDVRGGARSDPRTGALKRLDIGIFGDLVAPAPGLGAYYVTSLGARIQRVDAGGRLIASLSLAHVKDLIAGKLPPNPTGIVLGGGSIWLSQTNGTVLRIDPGLRHVEQTIKACRNALAIAYGEHAVWAACGEGIVVRVDPATNRASAPIAVGGLPRGIAAGGGSVWVAVN